MPSNGAQLQFDLFTDPDIMFSNKDETNDFFSNIRILPAGVDYGAVKKADAVAFSLVTLSNTENFNIFIDDVSTALVPSWNSYVELRNAFIAMQASYNILLQKLRTSGVLTP